jgi:hypothetical protein
MAIHIHFLCWVTCSDRMSRLCFAPAVAPLSGRAKQPACAGTPGRGWERGQAPGGTPTLMSTAPSCLTSGAAAEPAPGGTGRRPVDEHDLASSARRRTIAAASTCLPLARGRRLLGGDRLVTHHWGHGCFLADGEVLAGTPRVASIPGALVHSRYDVSRPLETAWRLHQAWPASRLIVVDERGVPRVAGPPPSLPLSTRCARPLSKIDRPP